MPVPEVITLGCRLNLAESETISAMLDDAISASSMSSTAAR